MKKYFALFALVIAASLFVTGCEEKEDKADLPKGIDVKNVRAVAAEWLQKLDKGYYSQGYDETAKYLQSKVAQDQWLNNMTTYRKPLGEAKKRKEINIFYKTELPDSPAGEYILIQYGTVFLENQAVIETIVLMKEDGKWKPSGYFMK